MIMKHPILFLLLTCLVLASCKSATDNGVSNGVLIPLKAGNTWRYEETTTDTLGNILQKRIDSSSVGLSVNIDGVSWSFFTPPGESTLNAGLFANKFGGLWALDPQTNTSMLQFPYPASAGYDYLFFADTSSDSIIFRLKIKISSTNEPVVTSKGTFSCYLYQARVEELNFITNKLKVSPVTSDIYIAPNIGMIKMVESSDGLSIDPTQRSSVISKILTDYTLN